MLTPTPCHAQLLAKYGAEKEPKRKEKEKEKPELPPMPGVPSNPVSFMHRSPIHAVAGGTVAPLQCQWAWVQLRMQSQR